MSTRSNIIIKNGRTEILLYRHCDGYLTGTGQDLHDDLSNSDFDNVGQYFNIAKFIEVDQEHEYGRGGTNKYKSLSEFQDAINKARKENE